MTFGAFRLNTLSAALASATNSITATGGTLSYFTSGSLLYKVHTITTTGSNSFIVSATTGTPTADILLVGGGGAGGGGSTTTGAGGGAGGGAVVSQTGIAISAQTYTISVGAGGTGVSGASGNAGTASTGLGYTANGGGAGTTNSAATNGGGSGTNSSTSFTSTAGTYAYKGGNSYGSATATNRAGAGGAGAGGAGGDGTSAIGGDGGIGTQNNIDGNNLYYAPGGGGGGEGSGKIFAGGNVYDNTGTSVGSASGNGGGQSNGGGAGYNNTTVYGGGGGGASTTSAAAAGGNGNQGIAIIRYPFTGNYVYFVSSATGSASTIAMPTVQTGDIVILNNNATSSTNAPTAVTPSGWTNVVNTSVNSSTALRMMIHYRVITNGASESGTTITGMSGGVTNRYNILVYRPSKTFTLSTTSVNQQAAVGTTAAITNQTLTMGVSGPSLAFAFYYSSSSGATYGSTTTVTRDVTNGATGDMKTFEASDSAISFATSTISLTNTTSSTLGLASFRLVLA